MDEKLQIKSIIDLYIKGSRTGDSSLLKSLFAENAIMSGDLPDVKLEISSPNSFFETIDGKIADESYECEITEINVVEDIAWATLKENNLLGLNFINNFQFQRSENEWKIISKLFTSWVSST
ncbi:nuclear transport factor 2 family protein [Vallitalea pronyensis]|uniref:Nuclear transport factor 2 family protein n=1 Tax=Vallitalea pronyensis TaxID=1348613 RepID=A0A8J8MLT2_9FIRM|nr:nuclear transport factor 2 family protein [Vallitalea pronyensis]QUI24110.1 nuclear transport factor 2 family protein [Vallitalea pronyensis]